MLHVSLLGEQRIDLEIPRMGQRCNRGMVTGHLPERVPQAELALHAQRKTF